MLVHEVLRCPRTAALCHHRHPKIIFFTVKKPLQDLLLSLSCTFLPTQTILHHQHIPSQVAIFYSLSFALDGAAHFCHIFSLVCASKDSKQGGTSPRIPDRDPVS